MIFLKYALSALLVILASCALVSLAFGWIWGLASFALIMTGVVARDTWHMLALKRWLQQHRIGSGYQPGSIWSQVFGQLYRLEKHAEQTQQKLREALDRFQHAGAALPSGVVVIDTTDRIRWCNPSAEKHLCIQLDQDRGQSLTYLIRQPEFGAYLKAPPSEQPLLLRRVRGNDLTLSIQVVPYSAEERMLVSHDISQMERDELVRQDFVANVSHELRTPLTVVGGFIETLLDGKPLDKDTQHRVLMTMQSQTERMQRLVEELLTLSRLESQLYSTPDDLVQVSVLMQQLVLMGRQLSQNQHEVQSEFTGSDTILGSESELLSAFGNLVSNAVRYTPAGGHISLGWRRERGDGIFSVQDSGIGIPPEHLPRLTERFYRVDRARSRETGGTGLGLAIVKQIAIHHDSRLEINSEPGKGSTFSFRIPAHRIAPK